MNENDYDVLLSKALEAYKSEQLSHIPSEDEIEYEFSESFEERSKALIKKQNGTFRRTVLLWAKRAAVFFLVLTVAVTAAVSTNAGRRPELGFKYEEYSDEGELKISFPACLYDKIETKYLPEMSEDLTVTDGVIGDPESIAITEWFDEQGEMISLKQFALKQIQLDDVQYNSLTTPVVNGIKVLLLQDDGGYSVYWVQNGYFFELWLSSHYELDLIYSVVGKLETEIVVRE